MTTRYIAVQIIFFALCFLFAAPISFASESEAGQAAVLASSFGPLLKDMRVVKLQAFLRQYDSPLEKYSVDFIRSADKYDLDWRLVVAIAGTESTFGKHIPPGSYNAWGWGIPTGASSGVGFTSWTDGIDTVSRGLKNNYINKGATTIDQIGRIYAASPFWAAHVGYFLDKIQSFNLQDSDFLPITI